VAFGTKEITPYARTVLIILSAVAIFTAAVGVHGENHAQK